MTTKQTHQYGYVAPETSWISLVQNSIRCEDPPPSPPVSPPVQPPAPNQSLLERVDRLTADKYELTSKATTLQSQLEAANAELQRMRTAPPPSPPPPPPPPAGRTQKEIDDEIAIGAQRLAAKAAFDSGCDAVLSDGATQYGKEKFDDTMQNFRKLAQGGLPEGVIQAAMDVGDAHHILFELGNNIAEANRIVALARSPVKLALELKKIGEKAASVARTAAPDPIPEIAGKGGVLGVPDPSDPARADKLDTKTWMKEREKQVAAGARR